MPEITMGGGLGFSSQANLRAVSERAKLAMPENKIGFFADVSSSYFLQKLRPGAGKWLGLTGLVINGDEAVQIGLATHKISSLSSKVKSNQIG